MKGFLLLFLAAAFLTGCNAVTYLHSERISIASVEGKTADTQQPIQGTVGLRTRTILVTPGKNGNPIQPGEAASVISDFTLDRTRDDGDWLTTTTITSGFITGKAAEKASNPAQTSLALKGLSLPRQVKLGLTNRVYNTLKIIPGDESDQLQKKFDAFAVYLPNDDRIKATTFYATSPTQDVNVISSNTINAMITSKQNFAKVAGYLDQLSKSINALNSLKLGPAKPTFKGQKLTATSKELVDIEIKKLTAEWRAAEALIQSDEVVDQAIVLIYK